jgi:hypothetical protein
MPIDKEKYPADWDALSYRIRKERAEDRCECVGECGLHKDRCPALYKHPHPVTGSTVILTVAHLDQDTYNNFPENLKAMCQRCHLIYDRNYYRDQSLSWVPLLSDVRLEALLNAEDAFYLEHISQHRAKARSMWGDNVVDAHEELLEELQKEWDRRNEPPPELDIG